MYRSFEMFCCHDFQGFSRSINVGYTTCSVSWVLSVYVFTAFLAIMGRNEIENFIKEQKPSKTLCITINKIILLKCHCIIQLNYITQLNKVIKLKALTLKSSADYRYVYF